MNKLWVRLVLAFLVVAWLGIGAMALVVRATTERSFRQYVNQREVSFFNDEVITSLETHYATTGSWAGVESLLPGRRGGGGQGSGAGQASGAGGGRGGQGQGGAVVLLADAAGLVVASTDETRIGTPLENDTREQAVELTVDGERVGWLAQETPGTQALGEAEQRFLNEATRWLTGAAIGAALLAVIVGIALAWQLTRPMRVLTDAAHDLAGGQLGRQVEVTGTAEITELGRAFNRMSRDLAAGETLRQRMAADIAHELRTPVSVLRGHLEAMLDGVFPLDAERLAVAYDRTIHLARLVDDLRLLTRAEAGQLPLQRVTITPADLVGQAVAGFAPLALDAGVTLTHEVAPDAPPVHVDVDRMQQVLGNLLTNALRHTPEGGRIGLHVTRAGGSARFAVTNSGESLTPEQAAHVFTPFWRAEETRERDSGGSGLGLAITRQLLALHGGSIWVESQPGQTAFVFDLPGEAVKPF